MNVQVFPGYDVSGNVNNQNSAVGIAGAFVTAFDANTNQYDTVIADGLGHYNDLHVPANVGLVFYTGADAYEGEFYYNVYDPAEATGIMTSAYSHIRYPVRPVCLQ